ncbi:MAG: hypothetical protein CG439_2806, partial [Methylococcaceae bacterium NSP1-2]
FLATQHKTNIVAGFVGLAIASPTYYRIVPTLWRGNAAVDAPASS